MPDRHRFVLHLSFVLFAALPACEASLPGPSLGGGGQQQGDPIEVAVRPSPELVDRIQASPHDFTWDHFRQHAVLSTEAESWTGELQLCAARVIGTQLVGSSCSRLLALTIEDLSGGVRSGELIPNSEWIPGEVWFSLNHWEPLDLWVGSEPVPPTGAGVTDAAVEALEPQTGQGTVVVYATGAQIAGVEPFAVLVGQR